MGLALQRASRERSIEAPLDGATMRELEDLAYELGSNATEELLDQSVEHDAITIESFAHLRYAGTDTALPVPLSEPHFMRRDFEVLHRQRFGFISPEKDIYVAALEVAAAGSDTSFSPLPDGERPEANANELPGEGEIRLGGRTPSPQPSPPRGEGVGGGQAAGATQTRFYSRGEWHDAPVLMREALQAGQAVPGPAIVIEPHQTIVVEAGWTLTR